MDKLKIGKAIHTIREQKGLSQVILASQAGITQTYLSLLENGQRMPSMEALDKIATALEVPVLFFVLLASDKNDIRADKREIMNEPIELLKQLILDKIG